MYLSSVAEEVIHKSDINDDFEGIYSTIIQNKVLDWIFHSVEIILLIFQHLSTRSYTNLTKELDHPKKICLIFKIFMMIINILNDIGSYIYIL